MAINNVADLFVATLEQAGVILPWAKDMDATREFKAFVAGPDGRAILNRYGFALPGEKPAGDER